MLSRVFRSYQKHSKFLLQIWVCPKVLKFPQKYSRFLKSSQEYSKVFHNSTQDFSQVLKISCEFSRSFTRSQDLSQIFKIFNKFLIYLANFQDLLQTLKIRVLKNSWDPSQILDIFHELLRVYLSLLKSASSALKSIQAFSKVLKTSRVFSSASKAHKKY